MQNKIKEQKILLSYLSEALSKVYRRPIHFTLAKDVVCISNDVSIYTDGKIVVRYNRTIITNYNCCILLSNEDVIINLNPDDFLNSLYKFITEFESVIAFDTEERNKVKKISEDGITNLLWDFYNTFKHLER